MLLNSILLAVLTADAPYMQSIEGVTVELVAISDGAGQVWSSTGQPLPDDAKDWNPKQAPPKFPRGPHKNALFLVHVSTANPDDVNIEASLAGSKMIGIGSSRSGRDREKVEARSVYQIKGVFSQDQNTTTLEIRVGSGAWTDEGAVAVKKNSLGGYNGTLLDGGRHGNSSCNRPAQSTVWP